MRGTGYRRTTDVIRDKTTKVSQRRECNRDRRWDGLQKELIALTAVYVDVAAQTAGSWAHTQNRRWRHCDPTLGHAVCAAALAPPSHPRGGRWAVARARRWGDD